MAGEGGSCGGGGDHPIHNCFPNFFRTPSGLDALDWTAWGGLTKADFVVGYVIRHFSVCGGSHSWPPPFIPPPIPRPIPHHVYRPPSSLLNGTNQRVKSTRSINAFKANGNKNALYKPDFSNPDTTKALIADDIRALGGITLPVCDGNLAHRN